MPLARHGLTAFTIRAWSRQTFRWAARQLILRQSTAMSEDAPVSVVTAVICLSSSCRLIKFSRDERPRGSLPAFAESDLV